jgi:SAM-dependent methyltransferase
VDFHGLAVLELGPGPDLGTGAFVLVEGAVTYCAVDQFPLAARSDAVLEYIRASLGVEFARDQIRYVLDDFPALGRVSGPFDAIVSNATLEHVNDIERLFRRLAELLRPGGIMCHHIDAKTHMRGFRKRDPLNIYRFSERIYRLLRFPGSPNRWLADDYASAARSAGFDIEVVPGRIAATEYLAATAPYLHPMYGDRSDLKYLTFTLNCRLRSQPRSVAISDSERPYIAQSESGSSKIGDDFDAAVGSSLTTSWSAGADARPAR